MSPRPSSSTAAPRVTIATPVPRSVSSGGSVVVVVAAAVVGVVAVAVGVVVFQSMPHALIVQTSLAKMTFTGSPNNMEGLSAL